MQTSLLLFHSSMFWLAFLILSVSNSFLRVNVYEPLAGELWSHIFATISFVLINLMIIYYFFIQKRKFKNQALKYEEANTSQPQIFSFERKRNMFLIGIWWLLLSVLFELLIGWIRGLDGLAHSERFSWLSFVSVMRWAKSHVVILLVVVQLVFPVLIGTLVFRMDKKRELIARDLRATKTK